MAEEMATENTTLNANKIVAQSHGWLLLSDVVLQCDRIFETLAGSFSFLAISWWNDGNLYHNDDYTGSQLSWAGDGMEIRRDLWIFFR